MSAVDVMDPSVDVGCPQPCDGSTPANIISVDHVARESSEDDSGSVMHGIIPKDNPDAAPGGTQDTQTQAQEREAQHLTPLNLAPAPTLILSTSKADGEVKLRMAETGPASDPPVTVAQLLAQSAERFGQQTALAWKDGEHWSKITYREYKEQCRIVAKSFLKLGLQRWHGVGILGFNSPEWFIADIAAILAGGLAVGIYTTNSAEACQYVAENCQANILVVENHKQLQKILQIQDKLPHLKAIIQYKDELKEKRPNLYTWAELLEMGREEPDDVLDKIISSQKPNQCCTLIYTSGTTGQPKGVMLSHDNLTWTAQVTGRTVRLSDADKAQEVVISYLPLSHIAAQMVDIWITMWIGAATHFAQPDALKGTLGVTLREVRPTAFLGVPRVWEKMQEQIKSVGAKSSTVRRKVAVWAKGVGLQTNLSKMQSNGAIAGVPLHYRLARQLVFRKVRRALGMDRCTKYYTGAAPISRDTLEFFLSLDIPLYELYGMSECSGPHTISLPESMRLTSCGKEILGCDTKLVNVDEEGNGEICFWGRHIFMGYLNMPDKTAEALDSEGWLRSGDLGKRDSDGFLFITGRIKELIITAGGENIPPVPIEDAVKEAMPLISNAMLIGDKRKFLSMLLTVKCKVNADTGVPEDELMPEAVELCRRLGSPATHVSQIASGWDRTINAAIQEAINSVNEHATSNAQRIQKWTVLEHDFSIPGGELGPTMKLKRPAVLDMYKEQIENFYKEGAAPSVPDNSLASK